MSISIVLSVESSVAYITLIHFLMVGIVRQHVRFEVVATAELQTADIAWKTTFFAHIFLDASI